MDRRIAGQRGSRIRNYTAAVRLGFSHPPLSRDSSASFYPLALTPALDCSEIVHALHPLNRPTLPKWI
jgi:hypothetical protein